MDIKEILDNFLLLYFGNEDHSKAQNLLINSIDLETQDQVEEFYELV
ncbi:hypothetical protein [Alkalicoccobacillus murimartini]|uniref:Uncharacterized protein n=1 Tax=Alkalicoccobacillus murimartini TaxID=171685 RepID=A0ABT9YLV6_9BACI|nr:hypothetical protein [Alkalicoccobacillus murimartini]MDQ0208866.1 hypothetical protein [Alkalicoccobacillus murimartini]